MTVPSWEEVAKTLPKSKKQEAEELDQAIALVEREGYVVHKPEPAAPLVKFDPARVRGKKRVRVGVISDWHAGSKFQQPTYLARHIRYMKRRGVDLFAAPGDLTDGTPKMHPGFEYETWAQGFDAQIDAACEMVPNVGKDMFLIGGNHDASHFKAAGGDIVKRMAEQREDFHYLDPGNATRNAIGYLDIGDVRLQLCHPHLGGTRVRSYRMETWIENLSTENKPNIVLMGNFHKPLQTDYRNVFGLMLPAYQAQSNWMASKSIASYVGGCILEFGYETRGLAPSVSVEWIIERIPIENDFPGGKR